MTKPGSQSGIGRSQAGFSNRTPTPAPESGGTGFSVVAPVISLPKGGGAIRGIGEKFTTNPVTGTGSLTVPVFASPGRAGSSPQLALSYDSGTGNSAFGFGWSLPLSSITRKTDKSLPFRPDATPRLPVLGDQSLQYRDEDEPDIFILSGAEDLVPSLLFQNNQWVRDVVPSRTLYGNRYSIHRYRPRTESHFARIERWVNLADPADVCWRSIAKDNVTTWYGKNSESRIVDPDHPFRIFSWLICETYDDKGNLTHYRYKPEDSVGIDLSQANERNRTDASRSANRYIKTICYGNRTPYFPDLTAPTPVALPEDWCFELVFDYGEHDATNPLPQEDATSWTCRTDPFSSYRSTFEVRSYRLCRRVLMFHHFADEPGVGVNCLVRSTDLSHALAPADVSQPPYSYLLSARQVGYVRQSGGGYFGRSLPPLEFQYTSAELDENVREIDEESLENLPYGVDGSHCRWVDLDGEGLSGILTEQAGNWYYKPNLSTVNQQPDGGILARFGPTQAVRKQPSLAALGAGRQQFMDLSGDGKLDLVDFQRPVSGFYERTDDNSWEAFRTFRSLPDLDWRDPDLKFIDLTGDGFPDVMISEDNAFTWHNSLAAGGFGPAQRLTHSFDEEKGPRIVFSDGTDSVFLADMSGDGLTDIVRIRNGEVCYWPNLGYGRFGAKVTMDHSPRFDRPEQFDGRRVHLADIDGTGTADIVYFAPLEVHIYFNQSGNGWGAKRVLTYYPAVEEFSAATTCDLLGNGTACLVWSSPLPGNARRPMRYIDLMGGQKPHLLVSIRNNLGAETVVQYAPSTKFYLADKLAETPWVTRLPFPVHVVERIETYDYISRNRFVTRYAYHHGYFDGAEREFHGFGRVDQWDTEEFAVLANSPEFPQASNLDQASSVPPILTRTWYHTGAFLEEQKVSTYLAHEYWTEENAGLTQDQADTMLLPDTILPDSVFLPDGSRKLYTLRSEEMREACRALRGSLLRQEIYAVDQTSKSSLPYSVSERNYTVELLQPQAQNRFAVFLVHPRETIDFHYERILYNAVGGSLVAPGTPGARSVADPSVTHAFTLAVDPFGNILRSAAIAYGRRYLDPALTADDQAKQTAIHATFSEASFTNAVVDDDTHRTPLGARLDFFELLQVQPDGTTPGVTNLFGFDQLSKDVALAGDGGHEIGFENLAPADLTPGQPYRRLLKRERTLYRPDDMGQSAGDGKALLQLGALESLALPGVSYKLALTPGLVAQVYRNAVSALLPDPGAVLASTAPDGGGYISSDSTWWISSGRIYYLPLPASPAAEASEARSSFYLPRRFEDSFGNATTLDYDKPHNLFPVQSTDATSDTTVAAYDYRVLLPSLLTDPNGNRSAASFDALGEVAGIALMGKTSESLGDSFATFTADLTQQQIDNFYSAADPHTLAPELLGTATRRVVYDLNCFYESRLRAPDNPSQWQPPFTATLARETHVSDPLPPGGLQIQISFDYSDGFGREIQQKIQAEPGPVVANGPVSTNRWIGSGWTIFNNKAKPVRRYEPFFSQLQKGHQFEFAMQVGVSPILFYDPVLRVVATVHPDHSWEKVVFGPWRQEFWDGNDTVFIADPKSDPDAGGYFRRLPDSHYLPTWLAQRPASLEAARTTIHAATPRTDHSDSLGRSFLSVAHNRFQRSNEGAPTEEFHSTRVIFDVEGNRRQVLDAMDRVVARYDYDLLGNHIHEASMDAGERWTLDDVAGRPIRTWNTRAQQIRTEYDSLRRPTGMFLTDAGAPEVRIGKTVYGNSLPNPEAKNQRGKPVQQYDQAGFLATADYDFKGNLLNTSRQFAQQYKAVIDWSGLVPLEDDFHVSRTNYDALNRPIEQTTPDGSRVRHIFNQGNLLERVEANLRGEPAVVHFVANIDYDAKGLRTLIEYGNGAKTTYDYDSLTFRLTRLRTTRNGAAFADDCPQPAVPGWPGCGLQDLNYIYDPVGNILHIRDDAQQSIYFRNRRVEPDADYIYDALYRLVEASGREHLGQNAGIPNAPAPSDAFDSLRIHLPQPGDGVAMGRYIERYIYDGAGNLCSLAHQGSDPANPGWTRVYNYSEPSQLEPARHNNRLSSTTIGQSTESYRYDGSAGLQGNITSMAHLPLMQWDFHDQLQATSRQAAGNAAREITWYVYDSGGRRVRKVTELANGALKEERAYLGGFEFYRHYAADGATVDLERETLHVTAGEDRVALVENRSKGNDGSPVRLIRYQFGNHLGSSVFELDEFAKLISYEEYLPYGGTAYQSVDTSREVPGKRYRFTALERDEESGLEYHVTRYYAPWLGRWCSPDSIGIEGGINLYEYASDPIALHDDTGTKPKDAQKAKAKKPQQEGAGQKATPHGKKHQPAKEKEKEKKESKKEEKNEAKPAGSDKHDHQKILVILEPKDKSHDFDPHIKPAQAAGYKVLQVKSGKDLLKQLKDVSKDGTIAILSFASHGIPEGIGGREDGRTGMYVNDQVPRYNSSKAITAKDLIDSVKKGDIKLDPNAKVILGGCRGLGGDDAEGHRWPGSRADAIASKLATGLGVAVIASFGRTTAGAKSGDTPNRTSTGQYEWVDPSGSTTKLKPTINIVPKKLDSASDL